MQQTENRNTFNEKVRVIGRDYKRITLYITCSLDILLYIIFYVLGCRNIVFWLSGQKKQISPKVSRIAKNDLYLVAGNS
jgi:hypothetical protein